MREVIRRIWITDDGREFQTEDSAVVHERMDAVSAFFLRRGLLQGDASDAAGCVLAGWAELKQIMDGSQARQPAMEKPLDPVNPARIG